MIRHFVLAILLTAMLLGAGSATSTWHQSATTVLTASVDSGQVPEMPALQSGIPFPEYRRTWQVLQQYRKLADSDPGGLLPIPQKNVRAGDLYSGTERLTSVLKMLGDLPADTDLQSRGVYEPSLVDSVKRFQRRHGLEPDGQLGRSTLAALNTPLSQRIAELELALDLWSSLPRQFARPPVLVNVPEFALHAYNNEFQSALTIKVVVGKAYHHQTPVFSSDMRYVIFRPPWNVPISIQVAELVPKLRKNPKYLQDENFQIVDRYGNVVSEELTDMRYLDYLRSGNLAIRQKPGPKNSLGLVKFVLPNDHDVYLHGTPAMSLFSQARRDFSHGCIRVQDPVALAKWALSNQPEWSEEEIRSAMDGGRTVRATVDPPIPVFIIYSTAWVTPDGEAHFFQDIYKRNAGLQAAIPAQRASGK